MDFISDKLYDEKYYFLGVSYVCYLLLASYLFGSLSDNGHGGMIVS
jgi:hypothetical protein